MSGASANAVTEPATAAPNVDNRRVQHADDRSTAQTAQPSTTSDARLRSEVLNVLAETTNGCFREVGYHEMRQRIAELESENRKLRDDYNILCRQFNDVRANHDKLVHDNYLLMNTLSQIEQGSKTDAGSLPGAMGTNIRLPVASHVAPSLYARDLPGSPVHTQVRIPVQTPVAGRHRISSGDGVNRQSINDQQSPVLLQQHRLQQAYQQPIVPSQRPPTHDAYLPYTYTTVPINQATSPFVLPSGRPQQPGVYAVQNPPPGNASASTGVVSGITNSPPGMVPSQGRLPSSLHSSPVVSSSIGRPGSSGHPTSTQYPSASGARAGASGSPVVTLPSPSVAGLARGGQPALGAPGHGILRGVPLRDQHGNSPVLASIPADAQKVPASGVTSSQPDYQSPQLLPTQAPVKRRQDDIGVENVEEGHKRARLHETIRSESSGGTVGYQTPSGDKTIPSKALTVGAPAIPPLQSVLASNTVASLVSSPKIMSATSLSPSGVQSASPAGPSPSEGKANGQQPTEVATQAPPSNTTNISIVPQIKEEEVDELEEDSDDDYDAEGLLLPQVAVDELIRTDPTDQSAKFCVICRSRAVEYQPSPNAGVDELVAHCSETHGNAWKRLRERRKA